MLLYPNLSLVCGKKSSQLDPFVLPMLSQISNATDCRARNLTVGMTERSADRSTNQMLCRARNLTVGRSAWKRATRISKLGLPQQRAQSPWELGRPLALGRPQEERSKRQPGVIRCAWEAHGDLPRMKDQSLPSTHHRRRATHCKQTPEKAGCKHLAVASETKRLNSSSMAQPAICRPVHRRLVR